MPSHIKKIPSALPTVVLAGRVNVGKSTLFNRISGTSRALVSREPGTTRDVKKTIISWSGVSFELMDTGGVTDNKQLTTNNLQQKIFEQTRKAIKGAAVTLLVVDTHAGITPLDRELVKIIRSHFPAHILLTANKADSPAKRLGVPDFIKLGLGDPIPVSAANGSGVGDLLDVIIKKLDQINIPSNAASFPAEAGIKNPPRPAETSLTALDQPSSPSKEGIPLSRGVPIRQVAEKQGVLPDSEKIGDDKHQPSIRICILGQPNVGKSSLLNAIVGEQRAIVHEEPHTTREPNDTTFTFDDQPITLIDTAGIRRKSQKADPLEKGGITLSLKSMKTSDIVWLVLDTHDLYVVQNRRLAGEIANAFKGCIIIINKWDLVPDKSTKTADEIRARIWGYYPHVHWAPILFTSARLGRGIEPLVRQSLMIAETRLKQIPEYDLKTFLIRSLKSHPPMRLGAQQKKPTFLSMRQTGTRPPTFTLKIQSSAELPTAYLRYLENNLRKKYDFTGTPLRINIDYVEHISRKK